MKKKKYWVVLALLAVFFLSSAVVKAAMLIPVADQAKGKAKADSSPAIGQSEEDWALTPPGLERVMFIHYKKGFAKPPWAGGGKKEKGPKCYDFLGRGVKWNELPVSYVVHPDLEATVSGAIFASAEAWDEATAKEFFSDSYIQDETANWDSDAPDGRNELVFGDYPDADVIAVAVVWGYFSGPPSMREIIEFDVLFDTDFIWGDATNPETPDVMDLQNIATHEIGHGVGLGDIYDTACSDVTMYGYSDYEETKKRTLESSDITGIRKLYEL